MRFVLTYCLILTLAQVTTSINSQKPLAAPRISEGENAKKSHYPPIVGLSQIDTTSNQRSSFCSGTIIHQNWILTAARCLKDKIDNISTIRVLSGSTSLSPDKPKEPSESVFEVEKIILHHEHGKTFESSNDVALAKIKGKFQISHVAVLQTSKQELKGKGIAFGWDPTPLHVKQQTEELCQSTWPDVKLPSNFTNQDKKAAKEQMICGTGTGGATCDKDTGSPLTSGPKNTLIGILSSSDTADCQTNFYMRVSYFVPWIEKSIGSKLPPHSPSSTSAAKEEVPDFRIIGGIRASKNDYPSIVSLSYPATQNQLNKTGAKNPPPEGGYLSFCGGTIIHKYWVLTAAHCLQERGSRNTMKPEEFRVLVGFTDLTPGKPLEPDEAVFEVAEIKVHARYNRRFINAEDVALVRIKNGDFKHNQIAKLQKPGPYAEGPATAYGWGMTKDNDLNSFSLHLMKVTDELCTDAQWIGDERVGNSIQEFDFDIVKPAVLCFGWHSERGTCTGDSGGPLVHGPDKILIGVASFVFRPCEKAGFFMRVKYYVPWIQEQTGVELQLRTIAAAAALESSAFCLALLLAVYVFNFMSI